MPHPFTLLITLTSFSAFASSANWTYTAQGNWGEVSEVCREGKKQSPIDIIKNKAKTVKYGSMKFSTKEKLGSLTLTNNGHGFSLSSEGMEKFILEGGNLDGKYKLAQFHFHWGNPAGSEHLVDGKQYPSEVHLVHYKAIYDNLTDALGSQKEDALAVVGVFIKTNDVALVDPWKKLDAAIKGAPDKGNTTAVDMGDATIMSILPDSKDFTHFWRYQGGLTTPTCNMQVVWTVMRDTLTLPKKLIDTMAKMKDTDGTVLTNTYREVQPLYDRKVYYNAGALLDGKLSCFVSFLAFCLFVFKF